MIVVYILTWPYFLTCTFCLTAIAGTYFISTWSRYPYYGLYIGQDSILQAWALISFFERLIMGF